MHIRNNLIANYAGQLWVAAMAFAFVPFYIKVLGVEAYGLIGFFAILQAGMAILDAGISPVLSREVALYGAGKDRNISGLLRSLEFVGLGGGLLFLGLMFFLAGWVAAEWLNSATISTEVMRFSIYSMTAVVCLRFFESLYKSVLSGLQKQVLLNGVNVFSSTLRNAGAACVLLINGASLEYFFVWQLVVSIFSISIYLFLAYRELSMRSIGFNLDFTYLIKVRVFVAGATSAALLAFFLGQIDKILLSYSLDLADFSYYAIAASLAGVLSLLVGPVSQAIYPYLVSIEVYSERVRAYRKACKLVSLVVVPAAGVVIFFPAQILYGWSGDRVLSEEVQPLLSILAAGNLFSGLMVLPFMLEYVSGRVSLVVKANLFALSVFSVCLFVLVPLYGGLGAAWGWLFLNLSYFLLMGWVVHRDFLRRDRWGWYFFDVGFPCIAVSLVCIAFRYLDFSFWNGRLGGVLLVFISWASSVILVFLIFGGRLFFSGLRLNK